MAGINDLRQARLNQTLRTLRILGEQAARIQQNETKTTVNEIKKAMLDSPMLSLTFASIFLLALSPFLLVLVILFGPALLILCAAVSVIAAAVMVTLSMSFVCLLCWTVLVSAITSCWRALKRTKERAIRRIKDELLYIVSTPARLWEEFKSWIHEIFTQPFRENRVIDDDF